NVFSDEKMNEVIDIHIPNGINFQTENNVVLAQQLNREFGGRRELLSCLRVMAHGGAHYDTDC
ncbi:12943_t:CDS:2, partial [Funneliformis geosporum]